MLAELGVFARQTGDAVMSVGQVCNEGWPTDARSSGLALAAWKEFREGFSTDHCTVRSPPMATFSGEDLVHRRVRVHRIVNSFSKIGGWVGLAGAAKTL
jgi:hypothetical protein